MSIEAMKQALEAWDDYDGGTLDHPLSSAMENLRTAIEQMDKQGGRDWSLLDEAKMFADDRPTSISDDLYQWALDAEEMIRRLVKAVNSAPVTPAQEPVAYSVGRTLYWHEGRGVSDAQLYTTPPAQPAPVREPAINYAKVYDFAEQYGLDYNFLCKVINDSLTTQPAAQRQWVGLSDDEIIQCTPTWGGTVEDFAQAIEAKLKEKNT